MEPQLRVPTVLYVVVLKQKKNIQKALCNLQVITFELKSKEGIIFEEELLNKSNKFAKIMTITSIIMAILAVTFGGLLPIIDDNKTLPLGAFPEYINLDLSFEIKVLIQTVMFYIFGLSYMFGDAVYATMLIHIRAHCKILQISLKSNYKNGKNFLKNKLKNIVFYHNTIISISRETENMFKYHILLSFMGISFVICCSMYEMSSSQTLDSNVIKNFLIILTLEFPVGIYCYLGHEVIVESQNIADACFQEENFETDLQFQKGLILIMRRSQVAITPTIGKLKPLSLITFVGVSKFICF
ncbi:hypothetical protein FQR65_LT09668 [Abscondita terminalis]|nr:hypothetical protein FQR65_LT09668 [Abscondita terminalis]